MSNLMRANREWSRRPADERFLSLPAMLDAAETHRQHSRAVVVPSKRLRAVPGEGNALLIEGPNGHGYAPTHWGFGQACQRIGAPADYLRKLPAELAADNLNYGFLTRDVEDVGVLITRAPNAPSGSLGAITGPNYGRVWNADVISALIDRFGDGVTGDWTIPGIFGNKVAPTNDNTTFYCSDRDMFVFLADESRRVTVPNRRGGKSGSLARGFFVWNSEVGSQTLGVGMFLFDYVCSNRIVWGAEGYIEKRVRHTVSAPVRWADEVAPLLVDYAKSSMAPIETAIASAQNRKLDDVAGFLATRFGKRAVDRLMAVHLAEEDRPIETVWDVVTAATAAARTIQHQDSRVAMEREAGELLRF